MSRRGNPYDRAVMEAWNSTFKIECGERFLNSEIARVEAFDFIDAFHNNSLGTVANRAGGAFGIAVLVSMTIAASGLALAALFRERNRRCAAGAPELRRHKGDAAPRAFYPVIDPDRCIGSKSCLKACPEGKVLGMQDGVPVLLQPEKCVGHGVCADECPVDAIRLVVGSREREVLLPSLRRGFESSRAGIHVVGELAGAPLLGHAVRQGLEIGALIASGMRPDRARADTEVAIVGAGPAGLATAFALEEAGVTYRVLERGRALSTIRSYPRGKVVTTRALALPGVGVLTRGRISREKLLARCTAALERGRIRVQERTELLAIDGVDGDFTLVTSTGPVRAHKIVLAMGRSGTPRRLGVPGEDLPKVARRLGDPATHRGKRMLVVGGGDAAAEAAVSLALAGAREVVLCHRGDDFSRCRVENKLDLQKLVSEGRVRVVLRARVARIDHGSVALSTPAGEFTLANDAVLLAIGGELPVALLDRAGVTLRRYTGEPLDLGLQRRTDRRTPMRSAALGMAALLVPAALAYWLQEAWDYYRLNVALRLRSPAHPFLRSSSPFGVTMGILSAALIALALAYCLRKRSARLVGVGNIRAWLDAHVIAGALCLFTVVVHAAFSATHALASATELALLGLIVTGAIGRYVYGRLGDGAAEPPAASRSGSAGARRNATGEAATGALHRAFSGPAAIKLALGSWRALHLLLAAFVAVAVAAHIAVLVLLGYAFG